MPDLRVATIAHTPDEAEVSAITDLAFVPGAGGGVLVSSAGWDGGLTTWTIAASGTALTRIDSADYGRDGVAGSAPSLTLIDTGAGPGLFTGGGIGGPLQLIPVSQDGALGTATRPGVLTGIAGDLGGTVAFSLTSGTVVYGAPGTGAGIARARFDAQGGLDGSATTPDRTATHADGAVLAVTEIGGQGWLLSAGQRDPGVTLWQIGATGNLTARASLAPEAGLWISAPTAMEVVRAGSDSFAVLASAGSGSLSVMRIGAGGTLAVTDHVIDDRDSRFAGVTALAVAELAGRAYVVAGGADDGVSLYELLPGGRLLARAHLADGLATTLADISALAMRAGSGGLDIFAASASEPGLTRLRFDPGPAGVIEAATGSGGTLTGTAGADLLTGTAGADRINGASGADVIRDGAGTDTLFGGGGADIFVLARDGTDDRIADFDCAEDRLDLSGWAGLRDISQIAFDTVPAGLRLRYGEEVLILTGADGVRVSVADLAQVPLFGATHLGLTGEPGLPGPGTPDPVLPKLPDDGRPDPRGPVTDPNPENPDTPPVRQVGTGRDDTLRGSWVSDLLIGRGGSDVLRGRGAGDVLKGGAGADTLSGGPGTDALLGNGGADRIVGGGGNDRMWGSGARDLLRGGAGDDQLLGGGGADRLVGGAGADRLTGGTGDDRMTGGGGADVFDLRGRTGRDTITDFDTRRDTIDLEQGLRFRDLRVSETADGDARIRIGADVVILLDTDPQAVKAGLFDF